MNQPPDALTVALTGQLFFVLVAAAILALIVSLLINNAALPARGDQIDAAARLE